MCTTAGSSVRPSVSVVLTSHVHPTRVERLIRNSSPKQQQPQQQQQQQNPKTKQNKTTTKKQQKNNKNKQTKKPSVKQMNDFRPVAVTFILAKCMERTVCG